jgi:hypothetical protein
MWAEVSPLPFRRHLPLPEVNPAAAVAEVPVVAVAVAAVAAGRVRFLASFNYAQNLVKLTGQH